jgi:hypothetical protein
MINETRTDYLKNYLSFKIKKTIKHLPDGFLFFAMIFRIYLPPKAKSRPTAIP